MGELRRARAPRPPVRAAARPAAGTADRVGGDEAARLLDLQRTAGNQAVTGLLATPVQRRADPDPAAPVTPAPAKRGRALNLADSHVLDPADAGDVPAAGDVAALRQEWRDLKARTEAATEAGQAVDPADAARFAEVNRLLGLRHKADAAETLEGNGYKDGPAAWYADVRQGTFLGETIKVHRLLAERLAAAESAFLAAVAGQALPEGGWVRSTSTLRGPSEGLHGLGLAIDLNPGTNPYLINPSKRSQGNTGEPLARSQGVRDVIDRAVLLVLGRTAEEEDFSAQPDIEDTSERVKASYDKLSDASGALRTYFTLTEDAQGPELERLVAALGARDPSGRTPAQWRRTIKADRKALAGMARRKRWQRPTSGFMDLPYELVQALTDQGLEWLGDNTIGSGRDIMHFDMRRLGPVKKIYSAEKGRWTALG